MKTVSITIGISVIVLALLGGAGYWFVQELAASGTEEIDEVAAQIEQREANEEPAETNTTEAKTTEAKTDVDMEEVQVQIFLHQMTHQKIIADKKRGAVEMSPENIENLLTIVRTNKDHYEHDAFYEDTLTAWADGNFSNVVTVHNTIWNWHNGTVGRATGIMSQEQEAAFVESHFR